MARPGLDDSALDVSLKRLSFGEAAALKAQHVDEALQADGKTPRQRRYSRAERLSSDDNYPEFLGDDSMWSWCDGRIPDDGLHRIHSARHVHGDGGAFVGGSWVDIEDCASEFNIEDGSCDKSCGTCPRSRSRKPAAKPDGSYDVIIVGAGCVGSAIARELSRTTASVLILEGADVSHAPSRPPHRPAPRAPRPPAHRERPAGRGLLSRAGRDAGRDEGQLGDHPRRLRRQAGLGARRPTTV